MLRHQDGAADGSLRGVVRSCFYVFVSLSLQSVSPEMNCWTFGNTHHLIFHRFSSILMFCWTLLLAEQRCCLDATGRADGRINNWQMIWMSSIAGLKKTKRPEHLSTQPLTPPATPISPTIQIIEDVVRQVFRKQKRKKAPGPDCVTPVCLRSCADQQAPHLDKDLQQITGTVQSLVMFQTLHHHPHPKEIQNYKPVALTSVVMK